MPGNPPRESPRERLRFDDGWRFHLGDVDTPLANKHIAAYMNNKAGWARGAARGPYDDSDWRDVTLPHDWAVEGEFSPDNHLNSGHLPRGVAWYRRHFALSEADRGKRITIDFDAVATHCTVYVNGHLLHRNFCGYTPFSVDITDVATFGNDALNVIAVRVDATYMEGWWYEGAGIYRHVYLTKTNPIHIAEGGVQVVATPTEDGGAEVVVRTTVVNASDVPAKVRLISVVDATVDAIDFHVDPHGTAGVSQELRLTSARLWSIESPTLYRMVSRLESPKSGSSPTEGGGVGAPDADHATIVLQPGVSSPHLTSPEGGGTRLTSAATFVGGKTGPYDAIETCFGVRTLRFDADHGFFLNDKHVLLKGVCIHQDHAGVGVAVPDSIQRFRVRRLKDMGCNAVRPGHHPLSPEFMDACDELGVLVLDENRNFGSSPEHLSQLRSMVFRDRNRPSVFAWCLCNEEPIQTTPIAKNIARTMADEVRSLDTTRPITAAMSGGILNDDSMADVVDLMGINYQIPQHDAFHAKHPKLPVILSETHCAYGTRGVQTTDPEKHRFAENDSDHAPWGALARTTWQHAVERPWIAGLFAWTGFDYRGESSPHEWPSVTSHWGIMDLCGFEKGAFYLHRQWWTETPIPPPPSDAPAVAIGIEVHPSFDSPIVADGCCTAPVTVFAIDAAGRRTTNAQHQITFTISGPARIIGVGNGDPTSHEPDKATSRKLFNGLAQCLVQTTDSSGAITLTANTHGMTPVAITFESSPATATPRVPVSTPRYLITEWRMSPVSADRPDPAIAPDAADMNSWLRVQPGDVACKPFKATLGGYAIYRAAAKLPKRLQTRGARLRFHELKGEVEVYVDNERASLVDGCVVLGAGIEPRAVAVLIRAMTPGSGLVGPVELLPAQ